MKDFFPMVLAWLQFFMRGTQPFLYPALTELLVICPTLSIPTWCLPLNFL